jgi:hypothetical protein
MRTYKYSKTEGIIMRRLLSKITSPIFVPLRRFVVWGDKTFGTCDMKLTLEPRWETPIEVITDDEESLSELQKKLSKDKANIVGLGEEE